ncbi:protein of unknown function (plasmid) [Thermococcus nautili]|uniref:hypothetical protein n=1 Tax=Thermococcus nautili TaxID=195522 RepID=UPI0025551E94|nr:hypothetical protein [Thermococcus nautili]CAI1494203.1 protein of unknown function [Thermococcus nautili]
MKRKEFEKFATQVRRAVMKALDDRINEIVKEVNQRGEEIRKEAEEWFKEEIKKNPEIILGGEAYAYREGTLSGTIYSKLGLKGAWIGLRYRKDWYSLDKAPVPDELKKKYQEYLELDKKLVKELNKLVILRKTVYYDLVAWKKRALKGKAYKEEPISFPAKYWDFVPEEFRESLTPSSSEEGRS